jgi:hypothetical protein
MRGITRGLLVSSLLWGASGAAHAQLNVQDVSFRRGVDRIDGVDESAFGEVIVVGDGITSVELTFPDTSTMALSPLTTREFRLQLVLNDEAELDTEFGPGSYELDFNSGEEVVTVDHVIPAVPSPAISSPLQNSQNNSPTTTSYTWTGCSAGVCDAATDHVSVSISAAGVPLASAILPAGTETWSPPVLGEDADFTFFVDNVSYRVGFEFADPGDSFTLFQSFFQSDSIDFSTGFKGLDEAPQGPFSVVVDDPANAILDPSGNVNTTLAGVAIDYDFEVSPGGKVTGTGNADVDGMGEFETPVTVKGKLKGKEGILALKVTTRIKSKQVGTEASAKYTREQSIAAATGDFTGSELLKGTVLGVKVEEGRPLADVIATPSDWQLDFTISTLDGRKLTATGVLIMGDGSMIDLAGKGTYKGTTSLNLKSSGDDKGASFGLKGFTVDAMGDISGGTLSYKAFGQSGSLTLP